MQMVRDIATCLYYTGIDPFTKKEVHVAKGIKDRKMQRALMQFFQTGKLVHGAGGVDRGGTAGPDWQRLRLPDPGSAAEGSHRGAPAPGQRPGLLPHGRQPGQGREARGAGLAEHGLPARAEDGETAEEERRWSRATAIANPSLGLARKRPPHPVVS